MICLVIVFDVIINVIDDLVNGYRLLCILGYNFIEMILLGC